MHRTSSPLVLAAALVATAGLASDAFGQARTWTGNGGNALWSNPANWSTNTAPPLTPSAEGWRLGTAGAPILVTDMDNNYAFGQLQFFNQNFTVNSSNGSTMTLFGFNTQEAIVLQDGRTGTVNVPVLLPDRTTFGTESNERILLTNGTSVLNLNGSVDAGPRALVKNGAGQLYLNAANTMGQYRFTNGLTGVGNDLAFGTGSIFHNNANVVTLFAHAGDRTLANNFLLGRGAANTGTFRFGQAPGGASLPPGGNFTLNGNISHADDAVDVRVDVVNGVTVTHNGLLGGGSPSTLFQKVGAGTLLLNRDNAGLTSGFDHFAGVVAVNANRALGGGTYFAREGTVTLTARNGSQVVANPVVLGGTAGLLNNPIVLGEATGSDLLFTNVITLDRLNSDITAANNVKPVNVAAGRTMVFNGLVTDGGNGYGLQKGGPGTLVLNNATYSGRTDVAGGRLILGGNLSDSPFTVGLPTSTDAVLSGSGTAGSLAVVNGTVSPQDDNTAGTLNVAGDLVLQGGRYLFNLGNPTASAGVGWDLIAAGGSLAVLSTTDAPFVVDVVGDPGTFDAFQDYVFTIATAGQGVGAFSSDVFAVNTTGFGPDLQGGTFAVEADGNNLNLVFTPIPEPAAAGLAALAGLTLLRRRRA